MPTDLEFSLGRVREKLQRKSGFGVLRHGFKRQDSTDVRGFRSFADYRLPAGFRFEFVCLV